MNETKPMVIGVLVNRFWRGPSADSHDFFMWILVKDDSTCELIYCTKLIGQQNLLSPVTKSSIYVPDKSRLDFQDHGVIKETGETYYIYRALLYNDDFNPRSALFPRGSVGGFYMIPLNLPLYRRRELSCTRTISLTPPKVSTNTVFDYIIDDLIDGSVNGLRAIDPFGNVVRVFIDVVGFVADYPASSKVLDVMNHGARAPCTHCTFRRRRDKKQSRYGYTASINSSRTSYSRDIFRTLALRSESFHERFANYMGFNEGNLKDIDVESKWPLLKLGLKSLQAKNTFKSMRNGRSILCNSFDPYVQNIVAPDHCLTGIAKGILQTIFEQLPNSNLRLQLDGLIRGALMELGFSSQACIFNIHTNKLHSCSMSYIYAILSIMPFAIEYLHLTTPPPAYTLLSTLRRLVFLTFWWPSKEIDGLDAFNYVHGKNRSKYYSDMRSLVVTYTDELNLFCTTYPNMMKNIDRPNVHRMVELYMHTIVIFGHALFISEMLLEAAHQPLKFSLSKNSSSNAHISAVHHVLFTDWLVRLQSLYIITRTGDQSIRTQALKNLRVLMFGDTIVQLEQSPDESEFLKQLDEHIEDTLKGPVLKLIARWYGQSKEFNWENNRQWVGISVIKSLCLLYTSDAADD